MSPGSLLVEPRSVAGPDLEQPAEPVRLVVVVRHGPGALARLAARLNPYPVLALGYAVGSDGHATVEVMAAAAGDRIAAVLARTVSVLSVHRL